MIMRTSHVSFKVPPISCDVISALQSNTSILYMSGSKFSQRLEFPISQVNFFNHIGYLRNNIAALIKARKPTKLLTNKLHGSIIAITTLLTRESFEIFSVSQTDLLASPTNKFLLLFLLFLKCLVLQEK